LRCHCFQKRRTVAVAALPAGLLKTQQTDRSQLPPVWVPTEALQNPQNHLLQEQVPLALLEKHQTLR
jgi:hypothetical protein